LNQAVYVCATPVIARAAEPCQDWPTSPEVTDENAAAADCRSPASASHAPAASPIGVEPAPATINAEFTSAASTEKFITPHPPHNEPCSRSTAPSPPDFALEIRTVPNRKRTIPGILGRGGRSEMTAHTLFSLARRVVGKVRELGIPGQRKRQFSPEIVRI